MKILFVNTPWNDGDRKGVRAGSRWPFTMKTMGMQIGYTPFPFFMAYAGAVAKRAGHNVRIIDAITMNLDEDVFIKMCKNTKPETIVLETSTPSINIDLKWAKELKDETGAKMILCGPHATTQAEELIQHDYVDVILQREYDYNVLDGINTHKGIVKAQGVANLAGLPRPLWEELPMYSYYDSTSALKPPVLSVMASRGCPFNCTFCLWNHVMYPQEGRHRQRSVEDVVCEIEEALHIYPKFKGVFFEDDTFGVDPNWQISFAHKYRKRIGLPFTIMGRADCVSFESLRALKDAGLVKFRFGVESGSQEIVDNCNKGLSLEKVNETVNWCRELQIKTHMTICYGLIGETVQSILATKEFLKSHNPQTYTTAVAMPYPGTTFYKQLKEKGLLETEDWSEYDGFIKAVYHTNTLSKEELEKAVYAGVR